MLNAELLHLKENPHKTRSASKKQTQPGAQCTESKGQSDSNTDKQEIQKLTA